MEVAQCANDGRRRQTLAEEADRPGLHCLDRVAFHACDGQHDDRQRRILGHD